jgi:hypothetical protein
MSVWNNHKENLCETQRRALRKDKTERIIRLQHLLESGFNVIEEYDNAFIFNKNKDYLVVTKDYEPMWSYTTK